LPGPAQADASTLKRSMENLTLFPFDVLMSPVVAGKTLVTNLRDIDDSPAVKIAYPIPGYIWLTGVQIGAGVLRGVTGAFELLPGLILLPFDASMDPLFDPADENEAIVDWDGIPFYHVRFGIDYTTAAY
ncbi:MAG: hypothetical protein ABFS46_23180, partial [Myxococcota bacterium]